MSALWSAVVWEDRDSKDGTGPEREACVCLLPTGEGVLRVWDLEHSELVSESEERYSWRDDVV